MLFYLQCWIAFKGSGLVQKFTIWEKMGKTGKRKGVKCG